MADYLRSAAPKHALLIWADAARIYTEIPAKDSTKLPPYVMAFTKSEGGLTKLLAFVTKRHNDHAGAPVFTKPEPTLKVLTGSALQQAHAQAVLKRLGVFK